MKHAAAVLVSSLGRSLGPSMKSLCVAAALLGSLSSARASAAAMRVAVIGAQMVHSDKLTRDKEWPAMLQKLVDPTYEIQNFGDCCSSVSLDYPKQRETHPYLKPPNNAAFKPGYNESVAYMPNIVIIGPWGKHDRELTTQVFGGTLDPVKFAADYETMITTYQMLPTHPKIIACLPIPIPFAMASGVVNDVILPATKMVLAKHPEITVVDLWAPFVGHKELYIADTGDRAGTHVTPDAGLHLIATTVFAVWKDAISGSGGSSDAGTPPGSGDASPPDEVGGGTPGTGGSGDGGSGGSATASSGGSGGGANAGGSGGSSATSSTGGTSGSSSGGASGSSSSGGSSGADSGGGSSSSGCSYANADAGGPASLLVVAFGLIIAGARRRRQRRAA